MQEIGSEKKERIGGVFMRKIKVLITVFVLMLILSMDLGTLFSDGTANNTQAETQEDDAFFKFSNLQHNLGCITSAVKGAVMSKVSGVTNSAADKYANAVADATTKSVEDAITKKEAESKK